MIDWDFTVYPQDYKLYKSGLEKFFGQELPQQTITIIDEIYKKIQELENQTQDTNHQVINMDIGA